ncbi:MAG TPA: helix-turn-helix transcriptional regulator [Ideonella sp.]|uniref:helix-turn-helix transcriptional regulator n=1 Tax=Ideonella sp. TaxID=1929293 RepID=UPI002E34417C|nr:helix-turn-helix transcriptional regulator [Ideonella sp.]HEX5683953.1 helix-turn-helix transcriptional regulator [Ideonella sp.]
MNDFASAAMLRLIQLGLQRQGLGMAPPPRASGAHVPLADKRALLDGLLQAHGAQVVIRLGEGAFDAREEPVTVALNMARDPLDLIGRWTRLERFVHSRHRVVVQASTACSLVLRHVSRDPRQPPTLAEDLLVLGLLVALLHRLGTPDLRVRIADEPGWRWQAGRWAEHPLPDDACCWALSWHPVAQGAPTTPAGGQDTAALAHRLLAADCGRRWTLQALAREMGMSTRSLQRHLAAGGSGFSGLVSSVRLSRSAKLLVETLQQPAQIAYVCGFADQGHFNREFKRFSALTPGEYRREFAVPRVG